MTLCVGGVQPQAVVPEEVQEVRPLPHRPAEPLVSSESYESYEVIREVVLRDD